MCKSQLEKIRWADNLVTTLFILKKKKLKKTITLCKTWYLANFKEFNEIIIIAFLNMWKYKYKYESILSLT